LITKNNLVMCLIFVASSTCLSSEKELYIGLDASMSYYSVAFDGKGGASVVDSRIDCYEDGCGSADGGHYLAYEGLAKDSSKWIRIKAKLKKSRWVVVRDSMLDWKVFRLSGNALIVPHLKLLLMKSEFDSIARN
jgi:hypothetical protein